MAQGDLLGWANSIRLNMASDSGRQFFQKQVQAQGFLFLDDYLDNILSGTKQEYVLWTTLLILNTHISAVPLSNF